MKPQKREKLELASTLADRVRQLRELRNMTVVDLAKVSRFTVKQIEDIESGIDVWLSFADRSALARALVVHVSVLKEVETCPSNLSNQAPPQPKVDLAELAEQVLAGELQIPCPKCGVILKTSIEDALDYEGNPIQFARAYCPKCPFALR